MSEHLKNESSAPVETMEDYAAELEASFRQIREGDILTGTVIDISENGILLDLKYYTDGLIHLDDFTDDPSFNFRENIHPGDEISATVIKKDDGEGHILLSSKEANEVLAWDKLKKYLEEGIRGFIPASKLALEYAEDLNEWLGKEIQVRVITADEQNKRLVLSAKEILREQLAQERKNLVSTVEIGLVTEGTVESIQPYGAFVKLSNGLSGLVHISQICEKRIKSPSAVVNVGDTVKVKVIDIKDGKLSLSMKAINDVAAEEIHEETIELPETEGLSTTLGSLFKNLKFD